MNNADKEPTVDRPELSDEQRRLIAELRSATRHETLACAFCDVDSPESLEAALLLGWSRIQVDDGMSWNYLGVCQDCALTIDEE